MGLCTLLFASFCSRNCTWCSNHESNLQTVVWKRNMNRCSGTGAVRRTSQCTDRCIWNHAITVPQSTAGDILLGVEGVLDASILTETVRRRLAEADLQARRPLRRPPRTMNHRHARLQGSYTKGAWRDEWYSVVFSKEFRFWLNNDHHRMRVWRRRDRADPSTICWAPYSSQSWNHCLGWYQLQQPATSSTRNGNIDSTAICWWGAAGRSTTLSSGYTKSHFLAW